ncbi:hypothetical protein ACFPVY_03980 [Flavobacterium qiangtangense]|uniref:DUF1902 domain-containing protein n=1 Tax=Flavobacterium qiangtangense TaxID=1442595 RepID=A0ABW1PLC0_9FLAO
MTRITTYALVKLNSELVIKDRAFPEESAIENITQQMSKMIDAGVLNIVDVYDYHGEIEEDEEGWEMEGTNLTVSIRLSEFDIFDWRHNKEKIKKKVLMALGEHELNLRTFSVYKNVANYYFINDYD